MIALLIFIALLYNIVIIAFIIGFNNVKPFSEKIDGKNTFSIVIPFRSEGENLPKLLKSIAGINYPTNLFEILLIDDYSTDNSVKIIEKFKANNSTTNIYILKNKNIEGSPKKNAITTAIKHSKFNWIITTDADCLVPENWLQCFNSFIAIKKSVFIAAPVKYISENLFLHKFQQLNFISLIGSTIGAFGLKKPILCNGANLCYLKSAFIEVNGFEGNNNIASGDDVFLLEKMLKKYPEKVHYLKSKNAIVITKPEKTWGHFFNQQLRWAGKSGSYSNNFTKLVGVIVFIENLAIVSLIFASFYSSVYLPILAVIIISKFSVDTILIFKTKKSLSIKNSLYFYLISSIFYPFFIVIISLTSLLKGYTWKGRNYNK